MGLIEIGAYPVTTSATDHNEHSAYTSSTSQIHLASKPAVEPSRILPLALGLPLLIGGSMAYRGCPYRYRIEVSSTMFCSSLLPSMRSRYVRISFGLGQRIYRKYLLLSLVPYP